VLIRYLHLGHVLRGEYFLNVFNILAPTLGFLKTGTFKKLRFSGIIESTIDYYRVKNLRPVSLKCIIIDFGLSTSVFCKYLKYFGGCNISDFSL